MDVFHPRWVDQLSDESADLLVDLLWRAECEGQVPEISLANFNFNVMIREYFIMLRQWST